MNEIGDVRVLAQQDAWRRLHDGHPRAEPCERLRQFAAARPAAEHDEPGGQFAQFPDGVRRVAASFRQAGNRQSDRRSARGDDDVAGGDVALAHAHGVRGRDGGVAHDAVHAEGGVAFHRVVGRDLLDGALDAFHHRAEIELHRRPLEAVLPGARRVGKHLRRTQQGLARHAARIQAVAAHAVALDQGDLGLDRCRDQRRDQAAGARSDDHQIGVEVRRLFEASQNAAAFDGIDDLLGEERREAEQGERDP